MAEYIVDKKAGEETLSHDRSASGEDIREMQSAGGQKFVRKRSKVDDQTGLHSDTKTVNHEEAADQSSIDVDAVESRPQTYGDAEDFLLECSGGGWTIPETLVYELEIDSQTALGAQDGIDSEANGPDQQERPEAEPPQLDRDN